MGKIDTTSLRNWNNGDTMNEADYEQERSLIVTANNDTHDRIVAVENSISTSPGASKVPKTDANGVLSLPSQSAMLARQTYFQEFASGTWYTVKFETEVYDVQAEYDPLTSRFTAKTAGIYAVSVKCSLTYRTSTSKVLMFLSKNGQNYVGIVDGNSRSAEGTVNVKLIAGDYIDVKLYASGGDSFTEPGNSMVYLSVAKIS